MPSIRLLFSSAGTYVFYKTPMVWRNSHQRNNGDTTMAFAQSFHKWAVAPFLIVCSQLFCISNAYAADIIFSTTRAVSSGYSAAVAADINGDGDMDVVGGHTTTDSPVVPSGLAWWDNSAGDGSVWTVHIIDAGSFATPWTADVDGDGNMDVLGADPSGNGTISWWENTAGNGTAWTEHAVATAFGGATSVFAVDVDGLALRNMHACTG